MSPQSLGLILFASGAIFLALVAGMLIVFYKFIKPSGSSNDSSMVLLQKQIELLRSQVQDSLAQNAQSAQQQMSSMSAQVQQQMGSATQNLLTTTGQLHSRLENLSEATARIFEATKNISSLEEILKPPKLRGGMGEILLENVLREILPSDQFYELQHAFKNGEIVDAIIKIKDGLIPVDAKFPLDNFRKMIHLQDAAEKESARKEFVKNVRKHIDDISRKYILPDEGTFNFALMYVPAENVYYEMIVRGEEIESAKGDLYTYATQRRVFPVSPNSFYPYLMTLALGFRGLRIESRAREILNELERLQSDLARFSKDFGVVGSHLSDAQKKFTEAEKRLSRVEDKIAFLKEGATGVDPSGILPGLTDTKAP